jgi:hypothetical protein
MCKNCKNAKYVREDSGKIQLKCNNDLNGIGVNGLHVCDNFKPNTSYTIYIPSININDLHICDDFKTKGENFTVIVQGTKN